MPIYTFTCEDNHKNDELRNYTHAGRWMKCRTCGKRAYRNGAYPVKFKYARGQDPWKTGDAERARVKEHNNSPEFKAARDRGEVITESEAGMSRDPDNMDGAIASSDSQTQIMAMDEASGARAMREHERAQKLSEVPYDDDLD